MAKEHKTIEQKHKQMFYPTVRVRTRKSGGSGTVVYSEKIGKEYHTYVITNHHVISNCINIERKWNSVLKKKVDTENLDTVFVEFFKYNNFSNCVGSFVVEADIVAYSEYDGGQDWALLRIRDKENKAEYVADMFPLDDVSSVHIFDKVFAVGASLGHPPIASEGHISYMDDEIDHFKYWMSSAPTIFGNCLPASALVFGDKGSPNSITKVKEGSNVYSFDGDSVITSKVSQQTVPIVKDTVRIKLNTRTLDASVDHPVLTAHNKGKTLQNGIWKNDWELQWKEAGKLDEDDIVAIATSIPETDTESKGKAYARFAGCYTGDGSSRERKGKGGDLTLHLFKEKHIDKYSNIIKEVYGKLPKHTTKGITLYSVDAARDVKKQGLTGKAATKRVPDWVFSLPREEKIEYIEGYMDSDGYRAPNHYQMEASNLPLIEDIRYLCISLGWRVSNLHSRRRKASSKNSKGVLIKATTDSHMFQAYPSSTKRYIPRDAYGLERLEVPNEMGFEKVRNIESLGAQPCFDITVPGTHNFIANGVFVHNSGGAVYRWSDKRKKYEYVGIPSRISVQAMGFSADAITHMGYFIPIDRIYKLLEDNDYQFIYDPSYSVEQCEAARKRKQEPEKEEDN